MKSKLKPCPFCGQKPMVMDKYSPEESATKYWVECRYGFCQCNPSTLFHSSRASAIKAWNKRSAYDENVVEMSRVLEEIRRISGEAVVDESAFRNHHRVTNINSIANTALIRAQVPCKESEAKG